MNIDRILQALHGVKRAGPDRWTACCPAHDSKSGSSLRIREAEDGRILVFDHGGCAVEDVLAAIGLGLADLFPDSGAQGVRAPPPVRPVTTIRHQSLSTYGLEVWGACRPVSGPARAYLEARGCVIPPADGDLRCHPTLQHPDGHVGPALVALVTHAQTREPMTLHRTWVQADGRKADIEKPRLLLGGHAKKHGVIRLWPDECVTYGVAITEGVETALSLAHAYTPAWACIDAGNLAVLPVLAGIETLVIGADHDDAGIKAAGTCADRWAAAGVDVRVIAPTGERQDWNDARAAA